VTGREAPRLRIACQQIAPAICQQEENRRTAKAAISEALGVGAGLIVLPELVTSGYVFRESDEVRSEALDRAAGVFDEWRELVAPSDAVVVGGFPELASDGRVYNSAAVVGATGILAVYRKIHLWDNEKRWFTPGGDVPPVVQTPFGKLGVLVCYDLEFPESVRALAIRGAEVIAIPTNWPLCPQPAGERPAVMIHAMSAARLSRVCVACCDRVGTERGTEWTGGSCIVDVDGWVLAERAKRDSGLISAEVDLVRARDKALNQHNDVLRDRRPDLYGALTDNG